MPTGSWLGRKVAILPERGTLLFATDLQGNLGDYLRLRAIYAREEAAENEPVLVLCGDIVHGPDPSISTPATWPDYLGSFYVDRSRELVLDYEQFAREARTLCLLGNHEHAHVGGPAVAKFYEDEAAVLDAALGEDRGRIRAFFASFPLIAVAPCGAVLTHAAPARTERDLRGFAQLRYEGYERYSINEMYGVDTVGALLWSRSATRAQARALLEATALEGRPGAFVAYGHDIVREGYEKVGDEQICVSTSYGLDDRNKVYLRLDLSARYGSVHDLRDGVEILQLYPEAGERSPGQ